jgi:hypothetical protein
MYPDPPPNHTDGYYWNYGLDDQGTVLAAIPKGLTYAPWSLGSPDLTKIKILLTRIL